jgi:hypothetical protein
VQHAYGIREIGIQFYSESLKGGDHLENLDAGGRILGHIASFHIIYI